MTFRVPKWMECSWKRLPCGRNDCKICGRINKDRAGHIAKGEDPNTMEAALEDVGRDFKEMFKMLEKDVNRLGIDIDNLDTNDIETEPGPNEFPLYRKVMAWRSDIYKLAEDAYDRLEAWPELDAGKDLLWYANTISAKTYRLLCDRWYIDKNRDNDEAKNADYDYTKEVLGQCFAIIKNSLEEILKREPEQKGKLNLALIFISDIEKQVLEI
ncbi:MAG: hypothetical protein ABIE43_01330 [Patescibacteria group bacterium]